MSTLAPAFGTSLAARSRQFAGGMRGKTESPEAYQGRMAANRASYQPSAPAPVTPAPSGNQVPETKNQAPPPTPAAPRPGGKLVPGRSAGSQVWQPDAPASNGGIPSPSANPATASFPGSRAAASPTGAPATQRLTDWNAGKPLPAASPAAPNPRQAPLRTAATRNPTFDGKSMAEFKGSRPGVPTLNGAMNTQSTGPVSNNPNFARYAPDTFDPLTSQAAALGKAAQIANDPQNQAHLALGQILSKPNPTAPPVTPTPAPASSLVMPPHIAARALQPANNPVVPGYNQAIATIGDEAFNKNFKARNPAVRLAPKPGKGQPFSNSALAGARADGGPVSAGKPYLVGERGPEIVAPTPPPPPKRSGLSILGNRSRPRSSTIALARLLGIKQENMKADGGPVSAGKPYLVGERGPEIIVPQKSGTVIPNHALPAPRTGWHSPQNAIDPAADPNASTPMDKPVHMPAGMRGPITRPPSKTRNWTTAGNPVIKDRNRPFIPIKSATMLARA